MKNYNRRGFLQTSTLGAIAASTLSVNCQNNLNSNRDGIYMGDFSDKPNNNIRAAFIGINRGSTHLKNFATLPGTEVVSFCLICNYIQYITPALQSRCVKYRFRPISVVHTIKFAEDIVEREFGKLKTYTDKLDNLKKYWGDEDKWKLMLDEVKPDVVFISTNWNSHAPMAIESMKKGAHAFVEVPLAVTLEEMWDIVNTSEKTKKHCMMMENVNYGRDELLFLNMCRKGLVGELLHAEAAYIHELRWQMYNEERGTGSWRTLHYANGKGNLYPTHGLGPVAQYMNLARGEDNFKTLVSFSSPALGRNIYSKKNFDKNHKWNKLDFSNGDMNTSIIKTVLGRTVMVQWDETSPRPYSRLNLIQGTLGTLAGFPTRVALENGFKDITKDHHSWVQGENLQKIYDEYDHPLYKRLNAKTKKS